MEPFIFNKLIDPDVMKDLYENDYPYIEKIFGMALDNLDEDLDKIIICRDNQDLEGLRRGIHKIKPTFGFMGMGELEKKCTLFEEMCKEPQSTDGLAQELNELLKAIGEGKRAVEEDYQKLIRHNKANP